ncbi:serine/threonine-protein kinase/endoribonuclease IRE2-like [Oscarella lobularis]|uniref:serine/threonine-protein kinase/endoribonuclease IRE2-like n=1 Tax=Oscarella lobularis TaxID=121494 RepID=UPI00331338E8
MAAASSSKEGDDDVAATFEDAFKAIINSPNKSELLGQSSSTPATSRIRRSTIYRKVLRKSGRHGIEEKCFAIKFTRYEGSHEPIHRLRELQALEAMRGHENILTQFSYEYKQGAKFTSVYQLLEPWEFSLSHQNLDEELRGCDMSRLDVLKGLVKGLDFLSSCETPIVHRGISPEAILICKDGDRMTTKIADFDLAKRIVGGNVSTHTGSGVDDWKPPDEEARVKYDIFGAGLIFHYVLTNGHELSHRKLYRSATAHLLNDKDEGKEDELNFSKLDELITERQGNPRKSDTEFFHLGAFRRLIGRMLSRYPDKRPSAKEVEEHCALWSLKESEDFFRNIDHCKELEKMDSMTKENWADKLEDCFSECLKTAKKVDTTSQSELARFLRNRIVHFETPDRGNPEVKKAFDGNASSLLTYFLNLFPYLIVDARLFHYPIPR